MDRRGFLQLSALSAGVSFCAWPQAYAFGRPKPAITVITGISPCTSAAHLHLLLKVFQEFALPVSYIFAASATEEQQRCEASATLFENTKASASLLEIVGFTPDLAIQSDYFQARNCYKTRQDLLQNDPGDQLEKLSSIACRISETPTAPGGVRSAGFRNILMLSSQSTSVITEIWPNGVLRVSGGQHIDLTKAAITWQDQKPVGTTTVHLISAQNLMALSLPELTDKIQKYCEQMLDAEMAGQISNILLRELQLRDDYGFERMVSVVLGSTAEEKDVLDPERIAFQKAVKALGIPIAELDMALFSNANDTLGLWVTTEDAPTKPTSTQPMLPIALSKNCPSLVGFSKALVPKMATVGIPVTLSSRPTKERGFNDCGHLVLPFHTANPDQAHFAEPTQGDQILLIASDQTRSKLDRHQLLRMLRNMQNDGVTRFIDIPSLVNRVTPRGPQISRVRKTQAALARSHQPRKALGDDARAEYIRDAKIAWVYFQKFTHPITGLCPATVDFSAKDKPQHHTITMWDAGSNINALVAAAELGFISKKDLQKRINKIIPSLRGRKSQGRLLPQGWIRTDRRKWGNRNFDGCDCGRLLAAFDNLRRYIGPNDAIEKMVASWDLDKVIIDGVLYSVTDGELSSTFESQCSHYLALALRRWEIEVKSPLDFTPNLSPSDQNVITVERASRLGVLGAEPLLLEGLELGMSKQSSILTDVLFTTQLEEYEQTATLTCMSESPIDRSPWFTYQGIQLDAPGRKWSIDVVGGMPDADKADLLKQVWVVSSKAAFLWAANRPHEYSDVLVDYVRENARGKYGFASSIYVASGKASRNYTDLNTNSIILQSIAHILRDGV